MISLPPSEQELELEIVDEEEWAAIEQALSQCEARGQPPPPPPPAAAPASAPAPADHADDSDGESVIITRVTRTDDPVAFIELDSSFASDAPAGAQGAYLRSPAAAAPTPVRAGWARGKCFGECDYLHAALHALMLSLLF
jgi:hypothetical protein